MRCDREVLIRKQVFSIGRLSLPMVALLIAAAVGCGSTQDPNLLPVFPATGKISFKGTAPSGAVVVLHPKSGAAKATNAELVCPRAQVQPDGTFALGSYGSDDGAPPGDYTVTMEWHKVVKTSGGEPDLGPNLLPPQYSRPQSSPIAVKVVAGKNDLPPIVLK